MGAKKTLSGCISFFLKKMLRRVQRMNGFRGSYDVVGGRPRALLQDGPGPASHHPGLAGGAQPNSQPASQAGGAGGHAQRGPRGRRAASGPVSQPVTQPTSSSANQPASQPASAFVSLDCKLVLGLWFRTTPTDFQCVSRVHVGRKKDPFWVHQLFFKKDASPGSADEWVPRQL